MLNHVLLYYFSPTGGTRACGEIVGQGISRNVSRVNLGLRESVASPDGDLTIFALPVFAGRIPAIMAEKIRALNGCGQRAVTLAVYGTRAYEDALLELNDVVTAAGFQIVASAAVIAQHSMVPAVGQGRPDQDDVRSITHFANEVLKKLENNDDSPVSVPGNHPYKDGMKVSAPPICLPECIRCGKCVAACPTHAIHLEEDGIKTEVSACMLCLACTSACPLEARVLPVPVQESISAKLAALISVRRENEYFL